MKKIINNPFLQLQNWFLQHKQILYRFYFPKQHHLHLIWILFLRAASNRLPKESKQHSRASGLLVAELQSLVSSWHPNRKLNDLLILLLVLNNKELYSLLNCHWVSGATAFLFSK